MKICIIFMTVSFALWGPLLAPGREIDGDEFSNDTLAYKLELLNHTFWRTEEKLSRRGVVGSRLRQVRDAWIEKNHLEAQFLRGDFYPDLLDERISVLREELRQMLANMSSPALREPELQDDLQAMRLTPERSSIDISRFSHAVSI
jgi:hypothetical protein